MGKVPLDQMKKVASILMCPACAGRICMDAPSESRLVCLHCGECYTVVDGIPVMIPEQVRLVDPELIQLYSNLPVRTETKGQAAFFAKQVAYIKERVNLDNKVVVDFGGAEGILSSYLVGAKNVIVTDISLPRLRQGASRRAANMTFVCGDIQTPFLSLQADVILLMSVLEHIPSPQDVLGNAVRLLRPGGVLVLLVPVCNLPFRKLVIWTFRKIKGMDIAQVRKEHLRVYSTDSVTAQVLEAGLTIEDIKRLSVLNQFGLLRRFTKFGARIGTLDMLLTSAVYLLARKP